MTRNGGPRADQDGASEPARDELEGEFAGAAGNPAEKGETPSPGIRDRGETSSAHDQAAIDLDTAHDRAS